MGGQPSDAPALSPPSPLQQGGQSSNAPALSPPGRSTHCPGTLAFITAAAGWSTQRCPWTFALFIDIAALS
ncbi:hypothetical protein ACOMHN_016859 [Nucella lapillus]